MKVIGIVGLISSGKSTVGKILEQYGCEVLNLDQMSHEVYKKGSDSYLKIINIWGEDILDSNKQISRKSLSEKVFIDDENEILKLENIVWPNLTNNLKKRLADLKNEDLVFIEGAKILNSNFIQYCDKVWCIVSSIENIKNRILSTSKNHKNLLQRLKNQINEYSYLTGVDEFIENNSTRQELENVVKLLLEKNKEGPI
ncbi:MAG: dephospho-CoA kinase [Dehalococcoidia bacterium]|tara:strand:+ start:1685 stop:2281 length:597 start_codon:yes stop_codon:yes gene_type:complete